jgi:hypothetical protein
MEHVESGQMETELYVALYFQKFGDFILNFKKIWKTIVDVANDGIYKHA